MDEPHAKPPSGARGGEERLGRTIHGRTAVNREGREPWRGGEKIGRIEERIYAFRSNARERKIFPFFSKNGKIGVVNEFLNIYFFCLSCNVVVGKRARITHSDE